MNPWTRPRTKLRPQLIGTLLSGLLLAACAAPPETAPLPAPTAELSVNTLTPPTPTSTPAPAATQPGATTAPIEPTITAADETAATAPIGCTPGAALTPAQTEGPYYKADTPERASLIDADTPGTKLILSGYVLTTDCQPVAGAWLDFWQADDAGAYDNAGYSFRGHQEADAAGRYELTTVIPGLYPGRTRHIHVKVQAPGGPVLTTQLYFPDEAANARDGIFNPALIVALQSTPASDAATFNFVINTH